MSPQRQAKARRALELREQGLENEAIAERLGGSRNYIAQLLKALSRLEG
jgi:transcriptional regulator